MSNGETRWAGIALSMIIVCALRRQAAGCYGTLSSFHTANTVYHAISHDKHFTHAALNPYSILRMCHIHTFSTITISSPLPVHPSSGSSIQILKLYIWGIKCQNLEGQNLHLQFCQIKTYRVLPPFPPSLESFEPLPLECFQ